MWCFTVFPIFLYLVGYFGGLPISRKRVFTKKTMKTSENGFKNLHLNAYINPSYLLEVIYGDKHCKQFYTCQRNMFSYMDHYTIDPQIWSSKTTKAKLSLFNKFLSSRHPSNSNTVTPTDGRLTVTVNKNAGRKPHQKKSGPVFTKLLKTRFLRFMLKNLENFKIFFLELRFSQERIHEKLFSRMKNGCSRLHLGYKTTVYSYLLAIFDHY